MKKEERLDYLIGPDNIRKMMNDNISKADASDELKIYEVSRSLAEELGIDPEVRTYLARYPLAEMPLNLKRYVDRAMAAVRTKREISIPVIPPGLPVSPAAPRYINGDGGLVEKEDLNNPFLKIPLDDMAKLVKRVVDGKYGLEIDYSHELAQYLEISIPGFGFDYMTGEPTDNNGNPSGSPTKLQYYDKSGTKKNFYPQEQMAPYETDPSDLIDRDLWVYVRISGPCSGTLKPEIIFEWERALIDTEAAETTSTFMGHYPIKNSLGEFLGNKVSFKKANGFMYMSGVETEGASMMAAIYDTEDFNSGNPAPNTAKMEYDKNLHNQAAPLFPDGDEFNGALYPMSLPDNEPLDLTPIFESGDATLQFAIKVRDMWINQEDIDDDETSIKFDLLIMIPLDLKVLNEAPSVNATTDKGTAINIQNNYVMLNLGDALEKNMGEGDLFGRKEDEENYLKYIQYVKISLKFSGADINIIDPGKLAVLVTPKNGSSRLMEKFENNASLMLTGDALSTIPFSPEFTVLLKKEENENFGSFRILRPLVPKFDFKLYVEAKAALEYTLDI
jgi:hypothetical protein